MVRDNSSVEGYDDVMVIKRAKNYPDSAKMKRRHDMRGEDMI